MKKIAYQYFLLVAAIAITAGTGLAQSKTTQALHDLNKDALALYFYKNTLRMINQSNSAEFDELIKDIEKMKFLLISKGQTFDTQQFKKLAGDYKKEGYEEIMTSRLEGRNFDIYMKDRNGKTEGTVVLVNDSADLYVLDILGSVPVAKIPQFFQKLDESSDIGKQIKNFTDAVGKKSKEN